MVSVHQHVPVLLLERAAMGIASSARPRDESSRDDRGSVHVQRTLTDNDSTSWRVSCHWTGACSIECYAQMRDLC